MSIVNIQRKTFLLALLLSFGASASVVNVDFNAPIIDGPDPGPPTGTHAGSDGALSTTGTIWNGVEYNSGGQSNLVDEFGTTTAVNLTILGDAGSVIELGSLNDLQESGLAWEGFEISNLLPGETYEVVFYGSFNAGFRITDLGDSSWDFCTNVFNPTYVLPGLEGGDYCHYASLTPFDIGGGVMGLRVDDMDGAVMGFQVTGLFPTPEIDVSGLGMSIPNGDVSPTILDDTDFGELDMHVDSVSHVFTVTNSGTGALSLTGTPRISISGTHASDFTLDTDAATPVAAGGGTTTFTITFDPGDIGLRSAGVSIANNDADENPYEFAIQGTGTVPPPIPPVPTIPTLSGWAMILLILTILLVTFVLIHQRQ
jgi:hypothetical protein